MFVGEAPGANEDKQGLPFVGQAGKLLDTLLGEIGLSARRRVHRERPQVPAARQPRPAAGRDRRLPGLPLPPARADRAARRLHARQLLDEAAARRPGDRHHAAARARGDPHDRAARRCGCTRSTTRRRRSTRRRCSRSCATDFARIPELLALSRRPSSPSRPSAELVVPEPELVAEVAATAERRRRSREPSPRSSGCSRPAGRRRRAPVRRVLVGRDRVALVVAPAPADQQVARRVALQPEARAARERDRRRVAGLDVGLQPVQRERRRTRGRARAPSPRSSAPCRRGARSRSSRGRRTGSSRGRSGRS